MRKCLVTAFLMTGFAFSSVAVADNPPKKGASASAKAEERSKPEAAAKAEEKPKTEAAKTEDKPKTEAAASGCKPDDVCGSDCSKTSVKCGSFTCDCKKGTAGDKCAVHNCK